MEKWRVDEVDIFSTVGILEEKRERASRMSRRSRKGRNELSSHKTRQARGRLNWKEPSWTNCEPVNFLTSSLLRFFRYLISHPLYNQYLSIIIFIDYRYKVRNLETASVGP